MSNWAKKPTDSNATEKMKKDIKTDQARTTLYLDSIKLKQLKRICLDNNTSMSAVVNKLIEEYVNKY